VTALDQSEFKSQNPQFYTTYKRGPLSDYLSVCDVGVPRSNCPACEQIGCRTITSTILDRFSLNLTCGSEMWLHQRLLFVRQTGSSLPILPFVKRFAV